MHAFIYFNNSLHLSIQYRIVIKKKQWNVSKLLLYWSMSLMLLLCFLLFKNEIKSLVPLHLTTRVFHLDTSTRTSIYYYLYNIVKLEGRLHTQKERPVKFNRESEWNKKMKRNTMSNWVWTPETHINSTQNSN